MCIGSSICKLYVRNGSRILLICLLNLISSCPGGESGGVSTVIHCHFTLNGNRVNPILFNYRSFNYHYLFFTFHGESRNVEKEQVREKCVSMEGKGVGELGDIC